MLYSEGIFRTSTPEGSISSNPERTAPRRRGVELGYIGVLQKRADSRNIKLFRSLRPSGILISLRRGGPGAFVYSLAGPEETEAQRKNRLVWNAQSVVELKPGLQLPQLQPMPSLRVLRCWWVDTMGCSQVWAAEVKTSLVAAWKRATSYPRGIICQMNRNISDFHLLWANFSRERWVDFLKPYAGRFLCYFWGLGSRADSPSQISENSKEYSAGCSCEFRFWSINRIWVLWSGMGMHGELLQPQSPHRLPADGLIASLRTQKNHSWASYCWDGWGGSVEVRFAGSGWPTMCQPDSPSCGEYCS